MKSFQSFSYDILISEAVSTQERQRAEILNQPETGVDPNADPDSGAGMGGPISDEQKPFNKPKKKSKTATKPQQPTTGQQTATKPQQPTTGQQTATTPQSSNKPQTVRPTRRPQKPSGFLDAKVQRALQKSREKEALKQAADVTKKTGKWSKLGTGLSRTVGVAGAGLEGAMAYQAEKEKGSGDVRAAGSAATQVGGGLIGAELGAKLGATLGTAIAPGLGTGAGALIGGGLGYMAGSELGQKTFKTVAGANAAERKAMQVANRQRQEGGARYGLGNATVSQKGKDIFMSSGAPGQRKTVQMAKTSVVTDPTTGKKEVGYLARKGGQVVYKRGQDPSSLAKTSTNPFERIGRTLFAGAYKQHDAAQAQKKLQQAQKSDIAYRKKLGA